MSEMVRLKMKVECSQIVLPQYSNTPVPHYSASCGTLLKLGYILGEFPSLSETFILREILALQEAGFEISIFALQRGAGDKIHEQALPLLASTIYRPRWTEARWWRNVIGFAGRHPLRVCAVPVRLAWQYRIHPVHLLKTLCRLPAALCFAYEAQAGRVAHLHAHFAFLPSDIAMMMATLMNIPFSVAVHARDIYTQSPHLLACKLSRAAFIVTCSQYNLDYLLNRVPGIRPESIRMARHGLDLNDFRPREQSRDLILSVGRLEEKKGFDRLVEACHILCMRGVLFNCAIIGEGKEEHRLRRMIRSNGLEQYVQIMPMVTQADLLPYYHRAALFVQPSVIAADRDRDVLPNVLLEAMALQVPVIASRIAAIPEAITDGETGLLTEPGDSADLADKMAYLLDEPARGQALAAKARHKIEIEYDIRQNVMPLKSLFNEER